MTEITADVIVNSTQPNLDLVCGSLSKSILKAAGYQILTECRNKYPNGITSNDIAITSGGSLTNSKFIFHTTSTIYVDNISCAQVII